MKNRQIPYQSVRGPFTVQILIFFARIITSVGPFSCGKIISQSIQLSNVYLSK